MAKVALGAIVDVPVFGVSATAIEPLSGVSATSRGVVGFEFLLGLPRFGAPMGRDLLMSLRGAII